MSCLILVQRGLFNFGSTWFVFCGSLRLYAETNKTDKYKTDKYKTFTPAILQPGYFFYSKNNYLHDMIIF